MVAASASKLFHVSFLKKCFTVLSDVCKALLTHSASLQPESAILTFLAPSLTSLRQGRRLRALGGGGGWSSRPHTRPPISQLPPTPLRSTPPRQPEVALGVVWGPPRKRPIRIESGAGSSRRKGGGQTEAAELERDTTHHAPPRTTTKLYL